MTFEEASAAKDQQLLRGEIESLARWEQAVLDVAKSGIERSRSAAASIATASSAIVTLYSGLLAFVSAVGVTGITLRAILTPTFLAVAIVLATAYLAHLSQLDGDASTSIGAAVGLNARSRARIAAFSAWAGQLVLRRARTLRAAVLALAIGMIAIPLAFVHLPGEGATNDSQIEWPKPDDSLPDELRILKFETELKAAVAKAETQAASQEFSWVDTGLFVVFATLGAGVVIIGSRRAS